MPTLIYSSVKPQFITVYYSRFPGTIPHFLIFFPSQLCFYIFIRNLILLQEQEQQRLRKKSFVCSICCEHVSWILGDNKRPLQRTSLSFKDGQYPPRREGNRVNYSRFPDLQIIFHNPFTPYITSQLSLLTTMRTSRYRNAGRLMTRGQGGSCWRCKWREAPGFNTIEGWAVPTAIMCVCIYMCCFQLPIL